MPQGRERAKGFRNISRSRLSIIRGLEAVNRSSLPNRGKDRCCLPQIDLCGPHEAQFLIAGSIIFKTSNRNSFSGIVAYLTRSRGDYFSYSWGKRFPSAFRLVPSRSALVTMLHI